jgi:hypothetical protein
VCWPLPWRPAQLLLACTRLAVLLCGWCYPGRPTPFTSPPTRDTNTACVVWAAAVRRNACPPHPPPRTPCASPPSAAQHQPTPSCFPDQPRPTLTLLTHPHAPQPPLQAIDPQLDVLCHSLLKQMRQLDALERGGAAAAAASALGALRPLRRIVGGLREVGPLVGAAAFGLRILTAATRRIPPAPSPPSPACTPSPPHLTQSPAH